MWVPVSKSAPRPTDDGNLRATISQIDEFLAMLSHELRQPLAAALAAIEIQKKSPNVDRREKARRVIEQQVRYIARLVGDLSEVSRISRGVVELRRERVELRNLLREAMAASEPMFDERKHAVSTSLCETPLHIQGDGIRLKQVFSNLLKNAAAYTPPGGAIRVSADLVDGRACVRVADNGSGIPKEMIDRIFELFQRGPHRADGQSAGIGLAVVRRIVELHGGSVRAHSDGAGRGAEFTVLLPLDPTS